MADMRTISAGDERPAESACAAGVAMAAVDEGRFVLKTTLGQQLQIQLPVRRSTGSLRSE